MHTQTCRRCGEEKEQQDYHPGKWGTRGTYCRACCNAYKRGWLDEHREQRAPRPPDRCVVCAVDVRRGLRRCADHKVQESRGYVAVHARIKRKRGAASLHPCTKCGDPAEEWAYDHADPDEVRGPTSRKRVVRYSVKVEHYQPMCRACHVWMDIKHRARA